MGFDPLILAAGRLRHKVQIYAPNEQQPDAYGSMSTQWILVLTTRAEIVSTTSSSYKDAFSQNALSAQCTEMVTIRFPGTSVVVEPGYRVVLAMRCLLCRL